LIALEDTKAATLYKAIKNVLQEDHLPIKQLIGIGTDGASTMVGVNHSLATLMKSDKPKIIIFKCICHSLHLAAAKASENLPTVLFFMIRETHNWFSNSPKRINAYKEIYKTLTEATQLKIQGLSGTRWLARLEAINGILDQWDALKMHFEIASDTERCYLAKQLHSAYTDP